MILTLALDPITLTAIGLGVSSLIGAGSSVVSAVDKPKAPAPPNQPAPPPPAQQPQGSQNSNAPQQTPSFLAAATQPQQQNTIGNGQGKTLLGQ